ncbi:MAG TPA: tetratricopeptide repeat protein [Spirochaetota bacterium]|nr:tetratricopeptide repeat protein [Spirochaetota bacterium]
MKLLTASLAVLLPFLTFGFDQTNYQKVSMLLWQNPRISDLEKEPLQLKKHIYELESKSDNNHISKIKLAIMYNSSSLLGDTGSAEKAYKLLLDIKNKEKLSEEIEMIILVYLGSSRSLMARDSYNPVNKMSYVKEATAFLDEAVSKYGKDNFLPRYVRGTVYSGLPDMFKKKSTAESDLNYIITEYESKKTIPDDLASEAFFNLGNIHKSNKKTDEAIIAWNKSIRLNPSSKSSEKAKKNIKKYGE